MFSSKSDKGDNKSSETDPWQDPTIFRKREKRDSLTSTAGQYPMTSTERTLLPLGQVFKRFRQFAGPSWDWISPENVRDWPKHLVWAGGSLMTSLDSKIDIDKCHPSQTSTCGFPSTVSLTK